MSNSMNGHTAVVANGIKSLDMMQKSHLNDTKANANNTKTSAQYERAIQHSLTETDQLKSINTQLLTKVQTLTSENTI